MPLVKRPAASRRTTRRKATAETRLSRLRRPGELSVEVWQAQLRRQSGREQPFLIDNLGAEPVAPAEIAAAAGVPEPSKASDPWATLVDAGLKLVESLAAPQSNEGTEARTAPASWLETDPKTGRTYLKLPAPEPETLQRLAGALSTLLAGRRQR